MSKPPTLSVQRIGGEQASSTTDKTLPFKLPLGFAFGAGIAWAGVVAFLMYVNGHNATGPLSWQHLLFYVLIVAAGVLTFLPLQHHMELPRLAFEGTCGTALFCYTIAFVPPPTGWFFSLPDLPVYCLLIVAIFWTTASVSLPFIYALRQRVVKQRANRLDVDQARRQSYEIATLAASIIVLAGLRVLTWVSVLLLALILATTELLFLSLRVRDYTGKVNV